MFFVGTYPLTIDAKSRLSIPYAVRDRMMTEAKGRSFCLVPGRRRGTLMMYPDVQFEKLRSKAVPTDGVTDSAYAWMQFEYSQTVIVEPDNQGRVLVPERLLSSAGIGHEATLIGVHDHLELWNRHEFEVFEQTSWQQYPAGRAEALAEVQAPAQPAGSSATT